MKKLKNLRWLAVLLAIGLLFAAVGFDGLPILAVESSADGSDVSGEAETSKDAAPICETCGIPMKHFLNRNWVDGYWVCINPSTGTTCGTGKDGEIPNPVVYKEIPFAWDNDTPLEEALTQVYTQQELWDMQYGTPAYSYVPTEEEWLKILMPSFLGYSLDGLKERAARKEVITQPPFYGISNKELCGFGSDVVCRPDILRQVREDDFYAYGYYYGVLQGENGLRLFQFYRRDTVEPYAFENVVVKDSLQLDGSLYQFTDDSYVDGLKDMWDRVNVDHKFLAPEDVFFTLSEIGDPFLDMFFDQMRPQDLFADVNTAPRYDNFGHSLQCEKVKTFANVKVTVNREFEFENSVEDPKPFDVDMWSQISKIETTHITDEGLLVCVYGGSYENRWSFDNNFEDGMTMDEYYDKLVTQKYYMADMYLIPWDEVHTNRYVLPQDR